MATMKSKTKYVCTDKDRLKEFMLSEGFIFKSSTLENDVYYLDQYLNMIDSDSCIRLRTINNKEMVLSFDGLTENLSQIGIEHKQNVYLDISQKDNIINFLSDLGYYKYVNMNILKETYIKKDKQYYYSISIDTIENIGNFIDYDIYSDESEENVNRKFLDFESKVKSCVGESINIKYRNYASEYLYNNLLKGENLSRILVEIDKIFVALKPDRLEESIKNNITLLNLELIEKLEQRGIAVEIVYSSPNEIMIETLKRILDRIGYNPTFINIKDIKELAVKETLILEKQKSIDFTEVAFITVVNRK